MGKVLYRRGYMIAISTILGIVLIIVTLLWNYRLSVIINFIGDGKKVPIRYLMATILILLLMTISRAVRDWYSGYVCEKLNHEIRKWYARNYINMSFCDLEDISTGSGISKLQNEIGEIGRFISSNLVQRIDDLINFSFTFIWLLIIDWKLTLSANLPVLLIMIYVYWSSRTIGRLTSKGKQEAERMNGISGSIASLFPVIRVYDASKMIMDRYAVHEADWKNAEKKKEKTKAKLMSLSGLLSTIPLMLLLLVGGKMVINGNMELGILYIFINLSGNISGIMMNMPSHIAELRQFIANVERVSFKTPSQKNIQNGGTV